MNPHESTTHAARPSQSNPRFVRGVSAEDAGRAFMVIRRGNRPPGMPYARPVIVTESGAVKDLTPQEYGRARRLWTGPDQRLPVGVADDLWRGQ